MLRPLTLLLALLCARRALCFTGLGLQGKVNTTNSKDYDIKCRDTYADSDPLKRSCRTMCSSWNYDKKSCCFEVFAPAKHNAGKCVAYCDQCGIELPVAVPDPKCHDTYQEPGCKVMCQRYWGFQSTKACCDDNFAPGKPSAGQCNEYCGYCKAKLEMGTLTVEPPPPPPPPPGPGCDAGGGCNRCLMRSPKGLCPEKVMTGEAPNCQNATLKPGDFCEADEECGTGNINNCDGMGSTGWDIYYWAKGNVATAPPPPKPTLSHKTCTGGTVWMPYSTWCPAKCSGYQPALCYNLRRSPKGDCQCHRGYMFDDAPGVMRCKKCPQAYGGNCMSVCDKVQARDCEYSPDRMDCTCAPGQVQDVSSTPPWKYSCVKPCQKKDQEVYVGMTFGYTCASLKTQHLCSTDTGRNYCPHTCGFCTVKPTICGSAPCANGGKCIEIKAKKTFACQCHSGFKGHTCTDVNECASGPCKNGATCVDGVNMYSCDCPKGKIGAECQAADPCTPNPCRDGFTCKVDAEGGNDCIVDTRPTTSPTAARAARTRRPANFWNNARCEGKLARRCASATLNKKCCQVILLLRKSCKSFFTSSKMKAAVSSKTAPCLTKFKVNLSPTGSSSS